MAFDKALNFPTTVIFRGTPIVIGVLPSVGAASQGLAYQVMQNDGTWTDLAPLKLPSMTTSDPSMMQWLEEHPQFSVLYGYWYNTANDTKVAAIRAVSDDIFIYVFRISYNSGYVLVDRFVFNSDDQTLNPAYEVRYQLSGQKYHPANGTDTLGYESDTDGFFFEPTTVLATVVNPESQAFDVQLVPTATQEEWRWHVVIIKDKQLKLYSFRKSSAYAFDANPMNMQYSDKGGQTQLNEVPAYTERSVRLVGQSLQLGCAARQYTIREKRRNASNREVVVSTDARMMVALLKSNQEVAILDLQLGLDGTLAAVDGEVEFPILNDDTKPTYVPVNGLNYAAYTVSSLQSTSAPTLLASVDGYVYCYGVDASAGVLAQAFDTLRQFWTSGSQATTPIKDGNLTRSGLVGRYSPDAFNTGVPRASNEQKLSWYNNSLLSIPVSVPFMVGQATSKTVLVRPMANDGNFLDRTTDASWSHMRKLFLPFTIGRATYIFTYRADNGGVDTREVHGDGTLGKETYADTYNNDYLNFVTYSIGVRVFLVGTRISRKITIRELQSNGTVGAISDELETSAYYDQIVTYNAGGRVFLLAHRESDNRFLIRELFANGKMSTADTYNKDDNRYYRSLCPYHIGGKTYLFAHSRTDNAAVTRELTADGGMSKDIQFSKWDHYALDVFPYYTTGGVYLFLQRADQKWRIRRLTAEGHWSELTDSGSFGQFFNCLTWYTAGGQTYLLGQSSNNTIRTYLLGPDGTRSKDAIDSQTWSNFYQIQTVVYPRVTPMLAPQVFEYGGLEDVHDVEIVRGLLFRGFVFQNALVGTTFRSETVDTLLTEFVDNMEIDAFLVGFIEGPPPVPSENMTGDRDYTDITSIHFDTTSTNTISFSSSRDRGVNAQIEGSWGAAASKLETSYSWLSGAQVQDFVSEVRPITQPLIGKQDKGVFVPDNIGIAIYSSVTAKVYALRLSSDPSTLVGYSHTRNTSRGNPTNTRIVSFKIDPSYQRNGDLKSYLDVDRDTQLKTAINRAYLSRNAFYEQFTPNAFKGYSADLPPNDMITQTSIINTYDWNGLAASMASTETAFGGSYNESAGGNFSILGLAGASAKGPADAYSLSVLVGGHMNLTVNKSKTEEVTAKMYTEFAITALDHGSSLKAGQVSGYRWSTYFLNADIPNFDALYNQVIDKKWLNSSDPDAALLRQLVNSRNPVWRIGHIVTNINTVTEADIAELAKQSAEKA